MHPLLKGRDLSLAALTLYTVFKTLCFDRTQLIKMLLIGCATLRSQKVEPNPSMLYPVVPLQATPTGCFSAEGPSYMRSAQTGSSLWNYVILLEGMFI